MFLLTVHNGLALIYQKTLCFVAYAGHDGSYPAYNALIWQVLPEKALETEAMKAQIV